MTNINCSSNCAHQKDGKCCLDKTSNQIFASNKDCAYFKERG